MVKKGAEVLRQKCTLVKDFNKVKNIIDDLGDTISYLKSIHDFRRGIGLAAPQIGETIRISVAEYDGKRYVLINPEIIENSDIKTPIREGCISFFEYRGMVPRFERVKVKAFNRDGKEYFIEAYGDFAMLLQHEMDHLDGILYIDHLPNGENSLILVKKQGRVNSLRAIP